jgi:hypothetical protein
MPAGLECTEKSVKYDFFGDLIPTFSCSAAYKFPLSLHKQGSSMNLAYSFFRESGSKSTPLISQFKADSLERFKRESSELNQKSNYICHKRFVNTNSQFKALVEYCITPTLLPGSFDSWIAATSVSTGKSLVAEMNLRGFSSAATEAATSQFIEGIREGNHP